ncbi:pyridoxamine 5'-phosphate oxidase family protein [Neogemmobacter tilapiae]|uniref:General stress protein n=1 Tax=Neogemmobacter tilapiae TaxID=875041 RepID=A0A918WQH2_9RHOB|nr:pyridoxamine 5'-phosphate oxidase family protein [Gemmobacter tilapiae]GHC66640.1 general stress protein [Gemmobacter tilapiae]
MTTEMEAADKFWDALKSDRTVMLGLPGRVDPRPMTALTHEDTPGTIWIFSAHGNALVDQNPQGSSAQFTFASKNHGLFSTVTGRLTLDHDRAMIEALWNPFIAAWYEGKEDPKLALLRFDPDQAQVWFDANSLFAGIKMLLGIDPKQDYQDKTATIRLA